MSDLGGGGGASEYACSRHCWHKKTLRFMENKKSHEHTQYLHQRKGAAFLLVLGVKFPRCGTAYNKSLNVYYVENLKNICTYVLLIPVVES